MAGSRRQPDVSDHITGEDDFERFVNDTGQMLYRSAFLLCGDHHLAEDLLQATYAKVFVSWCRVRKAENPVGYARTTLLHTFLSHRRLRRNAERPTETLPDRPGKDPREGDADTRLDLLAALARLAPADRAVLVARYWEDLSINETAAALGMSASAVGSRAKRALDRLRPHLTELFPERTIR